MKPHNNRLNKYQKINCNVIIHSYATTAGAAASGLAQIPFSDAFVLIPIQIAMITSIGSIFNVKVTEATAKGIIASTSAAFTGRCASQAIVGWVPGLGNFINASTAIALTEAIGWFAVNHFFEERDKYEWEKNGYTAASRLYEKKLRTQAEEFLRKKRKIDEETYIYEKLLDDYDKTINYLKEKLDLSEEDNIRLKEMITEYEQLIFLRDNDEI